jgi:type I restriction enzyme S subunit
LARVEIPLPPLTLQQQFVHIVETVEALREKQAASGREIDILFSGLMEKAFCGELIA